MELKIRPSKHNHFPLGGFLIKGSTIRIWLIELQNMNINLWDVRLYPIPGQQANSIWACLIIPNQLIDKGYDQKYELCQVVFPNFYIPEKSNITPYITIKDSQLLFSKGLYFYHPEVGFVVLEQVSLVELINNTKPTEKIIHQPELPVFIPKEIRQFQIIPLSTAEMSKKMEDKIFTPSKKMDDTPLDFVEKTKLSLYEKIFNKGKDEKGKKSDLMKSVDGFLEKVGGIGIFDKMLTDFDDLKDRNKKEVEKLMNLLKDNPDEALKYAIPLDEKGTSRGGPNPKGFQLSKRWINFSLFGDQIASNSGGGSIDIGDEFDQLGNQYRKTAQDFLNKKAYEKAAFVYMKLLKDYYSAAQALEKGKLYQEAAVIYLDHLNNKVNAAACYEKGNMIQKAIELNIELKAYEKVGDLNMLINEEKVAFEFYEKAITKLKTQSKYENASVIYFQKMGNKTKSQLTLLEGWDDACRSNCLKLYFSNIKDTKQLKKAYTAIYKNHLTQKHRRPFLKILHSEYRKQNEHTDYLRDTAYELIAQEALVDRLVVKELKHFNLDDMEIMRDIGRF